MDCSTVGPDTTEGLEKRIVAARAEFGISPSTRLAYEDLLYTKWKILACPVFGSPTMAESGQLFCVLAGSELSGRKVKPYTNGVIGRADVDFSGHPAKQAALLKILGNRFILSVAKALAEGHVLAEKTGLETETLHQLIDMLFSGPYTAYSTRMFSGDYHKRTEPLFAVDLVKKDTSHVIALAKFTGTKLKAVELVDAHLTVVKDHMGTRGDLTSIYGAVRKEAGLTFENRRYDPESQGTQNTKIIIIHYILLGII